MPGAASGQSTAVPICQVLEHYAGWVMAAKILSADVAQEGPESVEGLGGFGTSVPYPLFDDVPAKSQELMRFTCAGGRDI